MMCGPYIDTKGLAILVALILAIAFASVYGVISFFVPLR